MNAGGWWKRVPINVHRVERRTFLWQYSFKLWVNPNKSILINVLGFLNPSLSASVAQSGVAFGVLDFETYRFIERSKRSENRFRPTSCSRVAYWRIRHFQDMQINPRSIAFLRQPSMHWMPQHLQLTRLIHLVSKPWSSASWSFLWLLYFWVSGLHILFTSGLMSKALNNKWTTVFFFSTRIFPTLELFCPRLWRGGTAPGVVLPGSVQRPLTQNNRGNWYGLGIHRLLMFPLRPFPMMCAFLVGMV